MPPKFCTIFVQILPNSGASGVINFYHRIASFGTLIDICIDYKITKNQPNQSNFRFFLSYLKPVKSSTISFTQFLEILV